MLSLDEYIIEMTSSSDEGITSAIQNAMCQIILNQAVDAIKKLQHSQFDMICDKKLLENREFDELE